MESNNGSSFLAGVQTKDFIPWYFLLLHYPLLYFHHHIGCYIMIKCGYTTWNLFKTLPLTSCLELKISTVGIRKSSNWKLIIKQQTGGKSFPHSWQRQSFRNGLKMFKLKVGMYESIVSVFNVSKRSDFIGALLSEVSLDLSRNKRTESSILNVSKRLTYLRCVWFISSTQNLQGEKSLHRHWNVNSYYSAR